MDLLLQQQREEEEERRKQEILRLFESSAEEQEQLRGSARRRGGGEGLPGVDQRGAEAAPPRESDGPRPAAELPRDAAGAAAAPPVGGAGSVRAAGPPPPLPPPVAGGAPVKAGLAAAVSGPGRRKRGRPPKNAGEPKVSQPVARNKAEDEEDVCFICFDGGNLVLCDRR